MVFITDALPLISLATIEPILTERLKTHHSPLQYLAECHTRLHKRLQQLRQNVCIQHEHIYHIQKSPSSK